MFRSKRWFVNPFRALQSYPWPQPAATPGVLDKGQLWEEERTPYYDPKSFYPARLGEILDDRYQLATKLGYGTSATVWLARDLSQWRWSPERYVAIKIHSGGRLGPRNAENELRVAGLVSKANSGHEGRHFVRTSFDSFTVQGPNCQHICLAFEPLREPLWLVKTRFATNTIPSEILRFIVQMLLHGLDYLHRECHVIHTDLKPDNMMARLEDKSILERSATDEFENPLPQKICDDHTVYLSRNQYGHPTNMAKVLGIITITDFGFAVHGDGPHYGSIQVEPFRAPEVILDAGWSYSTDIWNLGVMLWDLLEEHSLFKAIDRSNTEYDERTHLAYIEALLGPPPKDLLLRGRRSSMFYNSSGQLEPPLDLPVIDFETSINQINGEEKRMFIKFVKKMLTWEPKDRQTAKELLDDPWLHTSFLEENSSHVP